MQTLRLTRAAYARLAAAGSFVGRRGELVGGEIIEMAPMNGPHATAITKAGLALRQAAGSGFVVREHVPLALDDSSEPEPDIAVAAGEPDDYVEDHPHTAVLVVEVSDTTLAYDRRRKGQLYAAAGIPEYWIINLGARELDVYRRPAPDPAAALGWRYAQRTVLADAAAVTPLAFPAAPVSVQSLLPRRR